MEKIASALLVFSVLTVFHAPPQDHGSITNVFAQLLWSGIKQLLIVFVLKEHLVLNVKFAQLQEDGIAIPTLVFALLQLLNGTEINVFVLPELSVLNVFHAPPQDRG